MVVREVSAEWVLGHQVLVLQVWALAHGVRGGNGWFPPTTGQKEEGRRKAFLLRRGILGVQEMVLQAMSLLQIGVG